MVTIVTRECKHCKDRLPIEDFPRSSPRDRYTCSPCAAKDRKFKDRRDAAIHYEDVHGKPPGLEWVYDPKWKTN